MAAAFRSIGVDATVSPDSDARTLELGGLHSSGEECLPHKVTLGDFLKVIESPDFEPDRAAFFMPTAQGPCRFGQYAPYLKQTLKTLGHDNVMVFSPTSLNGYEGLGNQTRNFLHVGWMAMVVGDILTKFLLKTRPYETTPGDSDEVFQQCLRDFEGPLACPGLKPKERLRSLRNLLEQMRERFHRVPAHYEKGRPLIGLVGEIFCRLNTFSNDDAARRIEQLGGECWLSDICEWVWYTNFNQHTRIISEQGKLSKAFLQYKLKTFVQHRCEHFLLDAVREDLVGYEEPEDIRELLQISESYLPSSGCIGEMVLSVGKTIYLHGKGADGIVDISPFTCMNGVICEAIYPAVSEAHDNMPIRNVYYDGVNTDLDRDLEIFLDLARSYQNRKKNKRRYPHYFS